MMRRVAARILVLVLIAGLAWHGQAQEYYIAPSSCDGYGSPVTHCQYYQQACTCETLVAQGLLPYGAQSLPTGSQDGSWAIGRACGHKLFKKTLFGKCWHESDIPVLAAIVTDQHGSAAYLYGNGVTKAELKVPKSCSVIYCYAPQPNIKPTVTKTAAFMATPSTAPPTWAITKTAAFTPPATGSTVTLFNGDTQEAAWTINVVRGGGGTSYTGSVQGTITITNPTNYEMSITSVIDRIQGAAGPQATVTCPAGVPLKVKACSNVRCTYTATYSTYPSAGTYTNVATVTYNGLGLGTDTAQGAANFVVGALPATGGGGIVTGGSGFEAGPASGGIVVGGGAMPLPPANGGIEFGAGRATVVDRQSRDSPYTFTSSGSVGYTTDLTCPATGAVVNVATLTTTTGLELSATATLRKVCYALTVRVANVAPAVTGSYTWQVKKTCTPPTVNLKAKQAPIKTYYTAQKPVYPPKAPAISYAPMTLYKPTARSGRRLQSATYTFQPVAPKAMYDAAVVGTSTCTVEFKRTNPPGFVAGVPSYAVIGDVFVQNPAPINAHLRAVRYTVTSPTGQTFSGVATCPSLVIAAGGTLQCRISASPPFNPAGGNIVAVASLANRANGVLSGKYTDFRSAAIPAAGTLGRRRLAQFTFFPPGSTNAPTDSPGIGSTPVPPAPLPAVPIPASGSQVGVSPDGIADQCADVSDAFSAPNGSPAAAVVVAGQVPSGRICSSQTFVYKLQFGPYADCATRVWTNTATLVTADSQKTARATQTITVKVSGCKDAAELLMLGVNSVSAVPQGDYTWTAKHSASPATTTISRGATATVKYTVSFQRGSSLKGSVSGKVFIANPATIPISMRSAQYFISQSCASAPSTGIVSCSTNTVPPASSASGPGVLTCSFQAAVPCSGQGSLQVLVVAASGLEMTSLPLALHFVAPKGQPAPKSQCAAVSDKHQGSITGKLASGAVPAGNICSSKTFTYSITYGPYTSCAARMATRVATVKASATTTATSNVAINLVGCPTGPAPPPNTESAQSPRGSGCVGQSSFWASCLSAARPTSKCAAGYSRLPAQGDTLFFSSGMSFRAILSSMSGTAYITAAKQFAAAQLNLLSGASMPDGVSQAYMNLGQALAGRSATASVSSTLQANLMSWGNTLTSYNRGSFQGSAPAC